MITFEAPSVVDLLQLLAPFVAAAFGLLIYGRQRKIDRRETLIEARRRVYKHFLDATFEHAEHRSEESRFNYDKSKTELLLVASDSVLKSIVMLQEASVMDDVALGRWDVHERVLPVIEAMRQDCFETSNISETELSYLTPIGKPTPLHPSPEGHFEPE